MCIGFGYATRLLLQKLTIPAAPDLSIDHVANAFSGAGLSVIPGGLYSISGNIGGPDVPVWLGLDAADPPTTLGGVRVLFDSTPAPILYASSQQILCIAPVGNYSSVHVETADAASNAVMISGYADAGLLSPGLLPQSGVQIFTENPDGSPNGSDNPAEPGAQIVLYATGSNPMPARLLIGSGSGVPVSVVADPRFAATIYRIRATLPADSPPGPVVVRLEFQAPGRGPLGVPIYVPFGNSVTVYVK